DRHASPEHLRDGLAAPERGAEVALRDAGEPLAELHEERLREPEALPQRLRLLLGDAGRILQLDGDDVAGDEAHRREDEERDEDEAQEPRAHALEDVDDHAASPPDGPVASRRIQSPSSIVLSSVRVYGCSGAVKMRSAGPASTASPRYMTIMSSDM